MGQWREILLTFFGVGDTDPEVGKGQEVGAGGKGGFGASQIF